MVWPMGEELKNVELVDLSGRVQPVPAQLLESNKVLLDLRSVMRTHYVVRLQTTRSVYSRKLLVQ